MHRTLTCRCGALALELDGAPMIGAECHCTSCRTAGALLRTLPGAPEFQSANGGTPYALYRKDRVRFTRGTDLLLAHRLTPESGTRRVVAACCNSPVFLEFQSGHWLSLYTSLWPAAEAPAMQLRTMVSDLPNAMHLDDRLPNAKRQTLGFYAALLGAWVAMGFRVPKLDFVRGTIDA